jgi:hypothetical protein
MLSVSRPTFANDAQWSKVRSLPLVHVAQFQICGCLQVWYKPADVLMVRAVNPAGRIERDRTSRI